MYIETERTPNPKSLKFIPDRPVTDGESADFRDAESAEGSPLAASLFALGEVTGVFVAPDFISVSQNDEEWQQLKPRVLGVLMEHFLSGEPALAPGVGSQADAAAESGDDDETVVLIRSIIDEKVRPAVARDGGDVIFESFDEGIVYLRMQGACSGCPSSIYTLKQGIENLLRYYVPDVIEVRQSA